MNWQAVRTIFAHEMARFWRTPWESLASPVVSTVLYFVVFGAAIGGRGSVPTVGVRGRARSPRRSAARGRW